MLTNLSVSIMKRILSVIFVIGVLFSSCKKDKSHTNNNNELHAVTFNVTGFSQQLADFGVTNKKVTSTALNSGKLATNAADTSLTNHIGVIYYLVYDSQGKFLHSIKQLSSDTNFGTIKDNLHIGSYTAVLAAGGNYLLAGGATLSTGSLYYFNAGTYYYDQDTFFKKIAINVTNTDVVAPVTLSRVVGKVLINIEDAIPADALSLTLTTSDAFLQDYNFGSLSPSTAMKSPYNVLINFKNSDIGTKNYQLSFLTLNTTTPFSIVLQAYGPSGSISKKTISNITCYPNKITLLTGNLFGGNGNTATGGLTLGVDSTWAGSTTIPF